MKIYTEEFIRNFDFWAGAKTNAEYFTLEELDTIEFLLNDLYPEGIDAVQLNDLFWFEFDWLCEILGLDPDEVMDR